MVSYVMFFCFLRDDGRTGSMYIYIKYKIKIMIVTTT